MSNSWKIVAKGKEVTNPAAKFFVAGLTVICGVVSAIFGVLVVILLICLSPVLAPLHFLQKAFGMQGMSREKNGKVQIIVNHTSFYFRK